MSFVLHRVGASLQEHAGSHPRILLDHPRLALLRQRGDGVCSPLVRRLIVQADAAVVSSPPVGHDYGECNLSDYEQLWQMPVGDSICALALAHLLTDERTYLVSAQEWALASCGYETWGRGEKDGVDLAAGRQLQGLSLFYDWCYDQLDSGVRQKVLDTLVFRGSRLYEAVKSGSVHWKHLYLHNHMHVGACGLGLAGFAVYDVFPDAQQWVELALKLFRRTMVSLGDDGASIEGVMYWEFCVENMLKFMYAARDLLSVDLFGCRWWEEAAAYRVYLSIPRNAWTPETSLVDIADCRRSSEYGPGHQLRALAAEFSDGQAQWLADQADQVGCDAGNGRWMDVLWHDPAVPATAPDTLPTTRHFENIGIVACRSDWSGDESLVALKCGPYIGHNAIEILAQDPGSAHVHPDANHFVVFGAGEWLLRDDGYRAKWTGQHNTLLVDGEGQMGEKWMWFRHQELLRLRPRPCITHAGFSPELDHIAGDATAAYSPRMGVLRFVRHLLFVRPNVLLVLDEVRLRRPRHLELRFHPENTDARQEGTDWLIRGQKSLLRMACLTSRGTAVKAENLTGIREEAGRAMFTLRMRTKRRHWRNAIGMSWSKIGERPRSITLEQEGTLWKFGTGLGCLGFDWETGTAQWL